MKRWTAKEIDLLFKNYPSKGAVGCCEIINKSYSAIKSKAQKLCVKTNSFSVSNPKPTIRVLSHNRVVSICHVYGETEHYLHKKNNPNCIKCAVKRSTINSRKYRQTLLGKYKHRLQTQIRGRFGHKKSFTKDLPYSPIQLYESLEAIREAQSNKCPMCCKLYNDVGFDIDHIIPLSSAKDSNQLFELFRLDNLSLLCPYCNRHVKRARIM